MKEPTIRECYDYWVAFLSEAEMLIEEDDEDNREMWQEQIDISRATIQHLGRMLEKDSMTREEEIKSSFGDLDKRMRFLQSERDRYRTLRCSVKSVNRRELIDEEIFRIDIRIEEVWDLIKARDRELEKAKEEAK